MIKKWEDVLNLLSKKYTYDMLKTLERGPKRFKGLSDACKNEKMRTQRLKEFENFNLITITPERVGRRSVSIYDLSDIGRRILKLTEYIKKFQGGKK
jgi:DNA-binding HxlR family transcriptional regulator